MSTPTRQLRLAPGPAAYLAQAGGTHGQAALVGYLLDRHETRWRSALAFLRERGWTVGEISTAMVHATSRDEIGRALLDLADAVCSGDRLVREALRPPERG